MSHRRISRAALAALAGLLLLAGLAGGAALAATRSSHLAIDKRIKVGLGPTTGAFWQGSLWVPSDPNAVATRGSPGRATINRIDPATNKVLTVLALPKASCSCLGPQWAGVASNALWNVGNGIVRIDAKTNTVARAIDAQPSTSLVEASGHLWAVQLSAPALIALDAKTGRLGRTVPLGDGFAGIAAAGFGSIWVPRNSPNLSTDPSVLLRVNPTTGAIVKSIRLTPISGISAVSNALAAYGSVWVTLPDDLTVVQIDPKTNTVKARIVLGPKNTPTGNRPFGLAAGGGSVWAVGDAALVRIDPKRARIAAQLKFSGPVHGSFRFVTYGAGAAWVTDWRGGLVYRVNAG
jgi:streptogramin lyase